MVLGEDIRNEDHSSLSSSSVAAPIDDSTNQVSLEMMESVIQRLQPNDRHELREMITQRGVISGAMISCAVLFWLVAVQKGGAALGDSDLPKSMLGDFGFSELSLIVPAIALLSTLIMSIGRERGHGVLSNIAGILVILGVFFIIEPFGHLILTGSVDIQTAMFASGRLIMLTVLIHFASRFFFDAMLLQWVRELILSNNIDLFPVQTEHDYEGQADEQPPLA